MNPTIRSPDLVYSEYLRNVYAFSYYPKRVCVVLRIQYPACSAPASYFHVDCPAVQYFSTLSQKQRD
jgi:hypothetical protein